MTALLLAGGTAVLWGIDAFLNKVVIDKYNSDPIVLIMIKFSFMALLGLVLVPIAGPRFAEMQNKAMVLFYVLAGTLALGVGEALLLFAYEQTNTPSIITMIAYCSPLVASLLFVLVLKEKLQPVVALGVGVTLVGMLLMALPTALPTT